MVPDAHPGGGVDLAEEGHIHLDVAGHGDGLVHIAAGQHRGGQVLDGEGGGALFKVAGQGAVVGHIADGQAGERTGDAHLGDLFERQGQGIGAVGLPGEGGGAVSVDAAVRHGFLIGSFLPEFDAHRLAGRSTGTHGQHTQQHQREQRCAGTFQECRHTTNRLSFAAEAAHGPARKIFPPVCHR